MTARSRLPASSAKLVARADNNGVSDVFLRLGATGGSPTTMRVSLSAAGNAVHGAVDPPVDQRRRATRLVRDRRRQR